MARRKPTDLNLLPGLFDDLEPAVHVPAVKNPVRKASAKVSADQMRGPRIVGDAGYSSAQMPADAPPVPAPIAPIEDVAPTEKLFFMSFGSGSSGNCAYLGTSNGGVLIDAGVDPTKVAAALLRKGVDMSAVAGIIMTHDHGDHVRYAYTFVRRFRHLRIYCTPKTLNGMLRRHNLSRRIKDYHQPVFKEFLFHLGAFAITPFDVSHDGTDNVGYMLEASGHRFVVATDMGMITERADYYMRLANHLMIEANYDMGMLMKGSYPEYLKARIIGATGHMDNIATSAYLSQIHTGRLRHIFLCHLSNDNNTPAIALETVKSALVAKGVTVGDFSGELPQRDADVQLMPLPRYDNTPLIVLR